MKKGIIIAIRDVETKNILGCYKQILPSDVPIQNTYAYSYTYEIQNQFMVNDIWQVAVQYFYLFVAI